MPLAVVRSPRRLPHVSDLVALGHARGLDAVGVTTAEPFASTRRHLERRRVAGLHAGMNFTYRHPGRSTDPGQALPGARALVVAARSYRRAPLADHAGSDAEHPGAASGPRGRVARYAWEDHYGPLRRALTVIAREIKAAGWRARVVADDNALIDREAAYRAGLGWYGKSANLLLPGHGSWFVLGSVVTDAPLAGHDAPTARVPDGCGPCTRCLEGCPTGAIVGPGVVDARRCLAWLLQVEGPFPREHRVALGDRLYGCDDCQEVCPPNRRVDRVEPAAGADPQAQITVDVLDLLSATDAELLARHGRWYVPRRQARYLRRNALVVLGNVGDGHAPRVVAALRRALSDPDPLVQGQAVWSARRLGRADLVGEHVAELAPGADRRGVDPLVRAELDASVEVRADDRGGRDDASRPLGASRERRL